VGRNQHIPFKIAFVDCTNSACSSTGSGSIVLVSFDFLDFLPLDCFGDDSSGRLESFCGSSCFNCSGSAIGLLGNSSVLEPLGPWVGSASFFSLDFFFLAGFGESTGVIGPDSCHPLLSMAEQMHLEYSVSGLYLGGLYLLFLRLFPVSSTSSCFLIDCLRIANIADALIGTTERRPGGWHLLSHYISYLVGLLGELFEILGYDVVFINAALVHKRIAHVFANVLFEICWLLWLLLRLWLWRLLLPIRSRLFRF
jgi:hypothetical protein